MAGPSRSEEHTSELQSPCNLVCRLLLEKTNRSEEHTSELQSPCNLVCRLLLVTNHHLPARRSGQIVLPEAHKSVSPNQPGCTAPTVSIAGVGVLVYVLLALRSDFFFFNEAAAPDNQPLSPPPALPI